MKDDQKESSGLNREEYVAPDYRRFVFEPTELMQSSGGNTLLGGDFKNDASNSNAASAFGGGNVGW